MNRLSITNRIALSLALLAISILIATRSLGLLPKPDEIRQQGRIALAESLAINCSLLISHGDQAGIDAALNAVVMRNDDVLSAGLRKNRQLLIEVGDHASNWNIAEGRKGTDTRMYVPILAADQKWGRLEIRFNEPASAGPLAFINHWFIKTLMFFGGVCLLAFNFYLRRALQHLDPSKVVPDRVRAALDTLAGGLVVLDKRQRIVLANRSFAKSVGSASEQLVGKSIRGFPWQSPQAGEEIPAFPWDLAVKNKGASRGAMLTLDIEGKEPRSFVVNVSPVIGDDKVLRGTLVNFNDVTALEQKKEQLIETLTSLRRSRAEIEQQNEKLKYLATRDPLTSCLNRRSFFEYFEDHWKSSINDRKPLACIMVDIDFFKNINDEHGHGTGDIVLKQVAECLRNSIREHDIVCRFGGEEFCVLLPETKIAGGFEMGEHIRQRIEALEFTDLSITASLGVSAISLGANDTQELLDQADKSLYVAKRNGRNQVIRWDQVPEDADFDESKITRTKPDDDDDHSIPFHAVTALASALSYRDADTAAHSARVADYAVALASRYMSLRDTYVVEVAALLHDIGKIGVPDAILLKPGPLTAQEWKIMEIHDRIGVEIISSSFNCEALTEIIKNHHALFGGDPGKPHRPQGEDIPLGARILSIADAFDAMVSDRVYRKGRSTQEAIAELRRCTGRQFDPHLIDAFVEVIEGQCSLTNHRSVPAEMSSLITKRSALHIGLQIENLAEAVDREDLDSLVAFATRLQSTAEKHDLTPIADAAQSLTEQASNDAELEELVKTTQELITLCRSTQRAYLEPETNLDTIRRHTVKAT